MALKINHEFVSQIPDSSDDDLVNSSDWNADLVYSGVLDVNNGGTGANTAAGAATNLEGSFNHDNLLGFVANEHIDWTSATDNLVTTGSVTGGSLIANGSTDPILSLAPGGTQKGYLGAETTGSSLLPNAAADDVVLAATGDGSLMLGAYSGDPFTDVFTIITEGLSGNEALRVHPGSGNVSFSTSTSIDDVTVAGDLALWHEDTGSDYPALRIIGSTSGGGVFPELWIQSGDGNDADYHISRNAFRLDSASGAFRRIDDGQGSARIFFNSDNDIEFGVDASTGSGTITFDTVMTIQNNGNIALPNETNSRLLFLNSNGDISTTDDLQYTTNLLELQNTALRVENTAGDAFEVVYGSSVYTGYRHNHPGDFNLGFRFNGSLFQCIDSSATGSDPDFWAGQIYYSIDVDNNEFGLFTSVPDSALDVHLPVDANNGITINQLFTSRQAYISIQEQGTLKYQLGKDTNNTFFMYDAANTKNFLTVDTSGNLYLQPSSGDLICGNSNSPINGGINAASPAEPWHIVADSTDNEGLRLEQNGTGTIRQSFYRSGTNKYNIGVTSGDVFFLFNASSTNNIITVDSSDNMAFPALGSSTGTDLVVDGSNIVYKKSSSRRYKKNIKPLGFNTSRVFDIELKEFDSIHTGAHSFGAIAEEVEKIFPELVNYDDKGRPESIAESKVIWCLLNEIKKLKESRKWQ